MAKTLSDAEAGRWDAAPREAFPRTQRQKDQVLAACGENEELAKLMLLFLDEANAAARHSNQVANELEELRSRVVELERR